MQNGEAIGNVRFSISHWGHHTCTINFVAYLLKRIAYRMQCRAADFIIFEREDWGFVEK